MNASNLHAKRGGYVSSVEMFIDFGKKMTAFKLHARTGGYV